MIFFPRVFSRERERENPRVDNFGFAVRGQSVRLSVHVVVVDRAAAFKQLSALSLPCGPFQTKGTTKTDRYSGCVENNNNGH
jgi:hypothetical protein